MKEYKSKLLSMFSRYGFAQSPVSHDEIMSFFYNRISLDDAYAMACDVYCGIDDIEAELLSILLEDNND